MSLDATLRTWGRWYNYQLSGAGMPKKHPKGFGPWKLKPSVPPAFNEEEMERVDRAYNELMTLNIQLGLVIAHHYRDGRIMSERKVREARRALERLL